MRGAIYNRFKGQIDVKEIDKPKTIKGSVLIKIKVTGICRSDWHGWMRHDQDINLPHVPGHEFAGIISEWIYRCRIA